MSRAPGDLDRSLAGQAAAARPSAHAAAGGSESSMRLEYGKAYQGIIVAAGQMEEAYDVKLDTPRVVVHDCTNAIGVVSALLGHTENMKLTVGTRCLVTWTGAGLITNLLPSELPDLAGADSRVSSTTDLLGSELYAADQEDQVRPINRGATPHADHVEGERDMTNALQVGIALLTHLAQLKAGDRAKVEACLLNGMVRIMSERYENSSAFGDFQIINDGGLQCIWHGTSYPHEALGVLKGEKWADEADNKVDFTSARETGRWRFSQYVGHIGNFISMFVTDPVNALATLAQERAGKFHMHVNNDGSFVMRSVADICFERVTRVTVPIQRKRLDAPDGKTRAQYAEINTTGLKQWKYADTNNCWYTAYQLRDYARWLSNYHAYARFLQSDDFEVKADSEMPAPSGTNAEDDVEAANGDYETIDVYACYRLMRDGSSVAIDGYGNCTTTTAYGIHMASSANIVLEAADSIFLLAGNNIFAKARRSIELIAQFGGILATAKTWWKMLCERGSIWIKSDSSSSKAAQYEPASGDPAAELADYAVVVDAPNGSAAMLAGNSIRVSSDGSAGDDTIPGKGDHEVQRAVLIQSVKGPVSLRGAKDVDLISTGQAGEAHVRIKSKNGHVLVSANRNIMQACQEYDINQKFCLKQDDLQILTSRTQVNTLMAHQQVFNPETGGPSPSGNLHYNHTRVLNNPEQMEPIEQGKEEMDAFKARDERLEQYFDSTPVLRAEDQSVYTARMPNDAFHLKSETQRILDERGDGYTDWDVRGVISDTRTACDPFPGAGLKLGEVRSKDTTPLGDVSSKDPAETNAVGAGLSGVGNYILKRKA